MKGKNKQKVTKIIEEKTSDVEEETSDVEEETSDVEEETSDVEEDIKEEPSSEDDQAIDDEQSETSGNEQEVEEGSDEESGLDLAASATDSDEDDDDEVDDEDDIVDNVKQEKEEIKPPKSKSERIREELLQKYQERQGKQLYIRFPHKVAETEEALEKEVKELTPLVVKVHKPRQKHARFCLVDFATNDERDIAFKNLKKLFSKGEHAKYVVSLPRTEREDLISELAERKIKSMENKKAKKRLKMASKKAENSYTSSVIVLNLPKTASVAQIRELFPSAVDIQVKTGKGKMTKDKSIAAVNLPSTMDARNAIKQKLSLGGNQLVIKFDNKMRKNKKQPIKNTPKVDETVAEEIEVPVEEDSEPTNKKPKLETNKFSKNDKQNVNKSSKKPFDKPSKNPFTKDNKGKNDNFKNKNFKNKNFKNKNFKNKNFKNNKPKFSSK